MSSLVGATNTPIPFQASASSPSSGSVPAQLQHVLNTSPDNTSSINPSAAAAAAASAIQTGSFTNALLPQMQSWSAEKLGKVSGVDTRECAF